MPEEALSYPHTPDILEPTHTDGAVCGRGRLCSPHHHLKGALGAVAYVCCVGGWGGGARVTPAHQSPKPAVVPTPPIGSQALCAATYLPHPTHRYARPPSLAESPITPPPPPPVSPPPLMLALRVLLEARP
jgi:hypothetical protein